MFENEEMIHQEASEPEAEPVDLECETSESDPETDIVKPEKKKEDWRKSLLKDIRDIVIVVLSFMLVYVLFFRMIVVVGDSMFDTLAQGDRLFLICGVLYNDPQPGDIVVASKDSFRNGEAIIKRVIATEGQTVDIDFETGTVYVDGVILYEEYISNPTTDSEGVKFPVIVPEGCVFVMGDNRGDSLDSRSHQIGFIDEREILGKAIFRVWPGTGSNENPIDFDFGRIGVIE